MSSKETPTMVQYRKIKEQHPECLLFFRLGDFYELFFEDATIASAALDIVLTTRGKKNGKAIPMCGVPVHASENYIARLIKQGFHVAICEQMEVPSPNQKGPLKRDIVRVVTPGTLTEDHLLEARDMHFLTAIVDDPETAHLGIAFLDLSTGDFFIERQPYAQLMSALERIRPKELLLSDKVIEKEPFSLCWQIFKKQTTLLPASRFTVEAGQRRLQTFFNVKTLDVFGGFSGAEAAAGGALVDYVLLTQKRPVLNLSRPRRLNQAHFVEIDAFTRSSLELFTTFSGEKEGGLLHAIDCTVTPMGARLLALRFTHPIKQLAVLEERLDSVSCFTQHTTHRRALREILKGVPDVERAFSRLFLGRQSPRDLGAVRTTLALLCQIQELLDGVLLPQELSVSAERLCGHDDLAQKLSKALVKDLPPLVRDGGFIAPGYSEDLDTMRSLGKDSEAIVEQLRIKYAQETQIPGLKINNNNQIGHYIEVPVSSAHKVPFHFVLRQSMASVSRYTTPELHAVEQRLSQAREEAIHQETLIFEELVEELLQRAEPLKAMMRSIAVIDLSAALAELAVTHNYTRPFLDTSTRFEVQGGRHPVVERFSTESPFVANDCILEPQLWLLTGPNMAGKSTFLRQNALIVMLAHIGSFVPAVSARIGLVDRLFSRVGAHDDIARGYSTFMVEMVETAAILNQATEKSFVIFDEIGRGTSTYDGLSLAWACVEYLLDVVHCRTLFATHYHELSALKVRSDIGFYTLKITSFEEQLVFLHKVVAGTAERSYGLHVARLAGMPENVLQRAQEVLEHLHSSSDASEEVLRSRCFTKDPSNTAVA